jgi:F-type H+-transporting ATPase subunit c
MDFSILTTVFLGATDATQVVSAGDANPMAAGLAILGAALGAGLSALAAAIGLSKIASSAAESMARQPDVKGDVRGASLLLGFLVEGVALFACVICILGVLDIGGLMTKALGIVTGTGS